MSAFTKVVWGDRSTLPDEGMHIEMVRCAPTGVASEPFVWATSVGVIRRATQEEIGENNWPQLALRNSRPFRTATTPIEDLHPDPDADDTIWWREVAP